MNPHIFKWTPILGVGVPRDSRILRTIAGVKTHWIKKFFISLKIYWNADVKMGSHHPFEYLKHKLWPKERLGVKLAIWLLTIKSQKSTRFPCVQVACNIPLKSSRQGLQLCFRPHLNRRSTHKVMGPQSDENPNFGNFRTPIWESQNKMSFGCGPLGKA
jgi:hypothetical protein